MEDCAKKTLGQTERLADSYLPRPPQLVCKGYKNIKV